VAITGKIEARDRELSAIPGAMVIRDNVGKELLRYEPNLQQRKAHASQAFETLYGGAAGGGKSYWLLMEALEHCLRGGRNARAVLFRRTFREAEDSLIEEALSVYPKELCDYNSQKHTFRFTNGASLRFANIEHKNDVRHYKSVSFTFAGFDELTTFLEYQYLYIFSRVRSKDPKIRARVCSATNPMDVGHAWVKKRFRCGRNSGVKAETPFEIPAQGSGEASTAVFIPGKLTDNLELMKADPGYLSRLRQLPPIEQAALIDGDWDIFAGQAFPEWDASVHICQPFAVPDTWPVLTCMDWGRTSPFYVGWIAIKPSTPERYYLIDEWYGAIEGGDGVKGVNMAASDVARGIMERERSHSIRVSYRIAPPDMWGPSSGRDEMNAAEVFASLGCRLKKADRDRIAGKLLIHELLKVDVDTLLPRLQFFSTCRAAIRTIPELIIDEGNLEDVDTRQEDHPYDAIRYGLVSRRPLRRGMTSLSTRDWEAITQSWRNPAML